VIVLGGFSLHTVHLELDGPLQAARAEADQAVGDLDAIQGGYHSPPSPIRTQHPIALQAAGHLATQAADRFRVLSLERAADGVVTQG